MRVILALWRSSAAVGPFALQAEGGPTVLLVQTDTDEVSVATDTFLLRCSAEIPRTVMQDLLPTQECWHLQRGLLVT